MPVHFQRIRQATAVAVRQYPAVLLLLTVIFAQLPFVLNLPGKALPLILWLLILPLVFPLRNCCCAAVVGLVAYLSAFFTVLLPSYHELDRVLVNSTVSGEFLVTVSDGGISRLPDAGRPRYVRCRLDSYRLHGEKSWMPGNGATIGVYFDSPAGAPGRKAQSYRKKTIVDYPAAGYGDRLYVRGRVDTMRSPPLEGQFDYGSYLRRNGLGLLLRPQEISLKTRGSGLLCGLYDFRDVILARILKPFTDDEAKGLASGILFGFGYNISHDTKESFIRSGTVHILTVSGTHVGLFAAFVLLVFAFLPFRSRSATVLALTFVYVFLTGMREPAVRAYIMLAFFLGGRIFLLKTSGKNTLALAAVFLLLLNPYNLVSAGFHFSFLTVWAILLLNPLILRVNEAFPVDKGWVAARNVDKWTFFKRSLCQKLLMSMAVSLAACLACSAISVFYQGVFPGATVAANMLLLPVVWWCFPLGVLAAFFSSLFSVLLELLLQFIGFLCVSFGELGVLDFASPPLWSVFLFLILTFAFLYFPPELSLHRRWESLSLEKVLQFKRYLVRERKIFLLKIPIALLMLALLFWWYFRPAAFPCQIGVFYGGSMDGKLTVALAETGERNGYVLNLATYEQAKSAETFLKNCGIWHCSDFIAEDGRKGCVDGLASFDLPVWTARVYGSQLKYLPESDTCKAEVLSAPSFSAKGKIAGKNGPVEIKDARDIKILKSREECRVILKRMSLELRCTRHPNGGTAVSVLREGKSVFYRVFPHSLYAESFVQGL